MRALIAFLLLVPTAGFAQGPFAPGAGSAGTTAIHKDSSVIVDWAHLCTVERGWQDHGFPALLASHGVQEDALGPADNLVVSLGDSGYATFTFPGFIYNGTGPDFVLFENAFGNFLELAFVEVSSDGINYVRFPATSLTPDTLQVDGFSEIDPTNIHNFAGKYGAGYGAPFDLEDLVDSTGIDLQSIKNVRVIDVIGALDEAFTTYDSQGNQVNDPFPTPFASSGHDLDACGVIHIIPNSVAEESAPAFKLYPNPATDLISVRSEEPVAIDILDLSGRLLHSEGLSAQVVQISIADFPAGIYLVRTTTESGAIATQKLIKR